MKALFFSVLLVVGLDEVFNHGAAVDTCWRLVGHLVRGTQTEVKESVYRR